MANSPGIPASLAALVAKPQFIGGPQPGAPMPQSGGALPGSDPFAAQMSQEALRDMQLQNQLRSQAGNALVGAPGGMGGMAGAAAGMGPTQDQLAALGNPVQGGVNPSQLGLHYTMPHGGIGHGILDVLKDIGISALAFTPRGPAQSIESAITGPAQRQYQASLAGKMRQVSQELAAQKGETEAEQPLATVLERPYSGGATLSGQAGLERSAVEQKWNDEQYSVALGKMSLEQQRNEIMDTLGREKINATIQGNELTFKSREDAVAAMTNIAASKGFNELSGSIQDWLMQAIGRAFVLPSGANVTPVNPSAPKATKGGTTAQKQAYLSNGVWYDAATHKPITK